MPPAAPATRARRAESPRPPLNAAVLSAAPAARGTHAPQPCIHREQPRSATSRLTKPRAQRVLRRTGWRGPRRTRAGVALRAPPAARGRARTPHGPSPPSPPAACGPPPPPANKSPPCEGRALRDNDADWGTEAIEEDGLGAWTAWVCGRHLGEDLAGLLLSKLELPVGQHLLRPGLPLLRLARHTLLRLQLPLPLQRLRLEQTAVL